METVNRVYKRSPVKFIASSQEFVLKFFSMLMLILMPIRPVMIAVLVLVALDALTGIWASKKEGKRFSSAELKKSATKLFVYLGCILVAFIIETYMISDVPIVKVVSGLVALTEGKSFFENVHRITGIDFWSEILKKVHGGSIKILPDETEKK